MPMKLDISEHSAHFTCIRKHTISGAWSISDAYENRRILDSSQFHMGVKPWSHLASDRGGGGSLAGGVRFEYTSNLFRGDSMCLTARVRPSEFARVYTSGMMLCFLLWSLYVC